MGTGCEREAHEVLRAGNVLDQSVEVVGVTFTKRLDGDNLRCAGSLYFRKCVFQKGVSFKDATIEGSVAFSECTFEPEDQEPKPPPNDDSKRAIGGRKKVTWTIDFCAARLAGRLSFQRCIFGERPASTESTVAPERRGAVGVDTLRVTFGLIGAELGTGLRLRLEIQQDDSKQDAKLVPLGNVNAEGLVSGGGVNLSGVDGRNLDLSKARVSGSVRLGYKLEHRERRLLNLDDGPLHAQNTVKGRMAPAGKSFGSWGKVDLRNATVGGNIGVRGVRVAVLIADNARIAGHFDATLEPWGFAARTVLNGLSLRSARLGGRVMLQGAQIGARCDLTSIECEEINLSPLHRWNDLELRAAESTTGRVYGLQTFVKGEVTMNSAIVRGDCILCGASIGRGVQGRGVRIGGALDAINSVWPVWRRDEVDQQATVIHDRINKVQSGPWVRNGQPDAMTPEEKAEIARTIRTSIGVSNVPNFPDTSVSIWFVDAQIGGYVSFSGAMLRSAINLSRAKIGGDVYMHHYGGAGDASEGHNTTIEANGLGTKNDEHGREAYRYGINMDGAEVRGTLYLHGLEAKNCLLDLRRLTCHSIEARSLSCDVFYLSGATVRKDVNLLGVSIGSMFLAMHARIAGLIDFRPDEDRLSRIGTRWHDEEDEFKCGTVNSANHVRGYCRTQYPNLLERRESFAVWLQSIHVEGEIRFDRAEIGSAVNLNLATVLGLVSFGMEGTQVGPGVIDDHFVSLTAEGAKLEGGLDLGGTFEAGILLDSATVGRDLTIRRLTIEREGGMDALREKGETYCYWRILSANFQDPSSTFGLRGHGARLAALRVLDVVQMQGLDLRQVRIDREFSIARRRPAELGTSIGDIDLGLAEIGGGLMIELFMGGRAAPLKIGRITVESARIEGRFSIVGPKGITERTSKRLLSVMSLDARGLHVGGRLSLENIDLGVASGDGKRGDLDLRTATVEGDVSVKDSRVGGALNARSLTVGGSFKINAVILGEWTGGEAQKAPLQRFSLRLTEATVSGRVEIRVVDATSALSLANLTVHNSLDVSECYWGPGLFLPGERTHAMLMDNLKVDFDAYFQSDVVEDRISVLHGRIGGTLVLEAIRLAKPKTDAVVATPPRKVSRTDLDDCKKLGTGGETKCRRKTYRKTAPAPEAPCFALDLSDLSVGHRLEIRQSGASQTHDDAQPIESLGMSLKDLNVQGTLDLSDAKIITEQQEFWNPTKIDASGMVFEDFEPPDLPHDAVLLGGRVRKPAPVAPLVERASSFFVVWQPVWFPVTLTLAFWILPVRVQPSVPASVHVDFSVLSLMPLLISGFIFFFGIRPRAEQYEEAVQVGAFLRETVFSYSLYDRFVAYYSDAGRRLTADRIFWWQKAREGGIRGHGVLHWTMVLFTGFGISPIPLLIVGVLAIVTFKSFWVLAGGNAWAGLGQTGNAAVPIFSWGPLNDQMPKHAVVQISLFKLNGPLHIELHLLTLVLAMRVAVIAALALTAPSWSALFRRVRR